MNKESLKHVQVAQTRPLFDVLDEWVIHCAEREAHERRGPVLASRDEGFQRLALEHFERRHQIDPGVAGDALLDCMAGWYLGCGSV